MDDLKRHEHLITDPAADDDETKRDGSGAPGTRRGEIVQPDLDSAAADLMNSITAEPVPDGIMALATCLARSLRTEDTTSRD